MLNVLHGVYIFIFHVRMCRFECMYVCMYVCAYLCLYKYMLSFVLSMVLGIYLVHAFCIFLSALTTVVRISKVYMYVFMYCMYVCTYVCMYAECVCALVPEFMVAIIVVILP